MNTDRQDYNQYNLLTPLTYGGVSEYNKSNQKKQNAQIRQLVRELNIAPSKDKLQQTYTLILASILSQNTSILKDVYTRYMNTQYKQSNPTLTKYEMDLIANKLYEVYQIRKDYPMSLSVMIGLNKKARLCLFVDLIDKHGEVWASQFWNLENRQAETLSQELEALLKIVIWLI
ncbi:hypothetical protein HpBGD54_00010 [Helicobacter pylori]|uniref:hypothetical protein n=1 Tax=Helicobacter pylori TaxID=210 RepID=UPI00308772D2|nr:hypothetical protein KVC21_00280 [Helicobacter pylori]